MTEVETQFYEESGKLIEEMLHDSPTFATFLGDHRFDDRFGDFSVEALADQRRRTGQWLDHFNRYDTCGWSIDSRIDRIILIQMCKKTIRDYDKIRSLERNPGGAQEVFWGIDSLIMRDFAPLPDRLRSILGRLNDVSRVLKETEALIRPHEVPKVWAEVALESARWGTSMFTDLIPSLSGSAPAIRQELLEAAENAAAALDAHCTWLEREILPQAQGNFVAGKELFNEMLHENHLVDYDADELCVTGWKIYEETEAELREVARSIDPHKSIKQLLNDDKAVHPSADNLLDTYRQCMSNSRRFVIERNLATIPESESIRIEATPSYERAVLPYAAYNMPGFFEKHQEGIFWVTPADDNADPEAIERKLRGHPLSGIPTTAVHEAYPGHHLQLVVANTIGSIPRKFGGFLSTLFVEGWAFYCEELMERLGFTDQPIQKLARLHGQLWRACRIIIDASLHTGKMSIDEAIRFLIERAMLEPGDAKAEVLRYTQSPTQPQSYLMGKFQLLDIIDEYRRRFPAASMLQMHDAILRCGSLPPKLMRMSLFGETPC